MSIRPSQLDIYRTRIPMKGFSHAAATRDVAEAVVVKLTFSDGAVGYGETLPRPYVTGETMDSVVDDIAEYLWPACRTKRLIDPGWALRALPETREGRCINAAACAIDLAAYRRYPPGLFPHVVPSVKVSGVLGSVDPAETAKRLWQFRFFGIRDFKLKLGLGDDVDAANLDIVCRKLGRRLRTGTFSLRADVNGGWDAETTPERIDALKAYGVIAVEQPVYCPPDEYVALARRCSLPLLADEALLTEADAEVLLTAPRQVWWNVRISKNGGLLRSLRLLRRAAEHGVTCAVGCMVGESGILSAAQRRLLAAAPPVRFAEGNYGRFLLADDLTNEFPTGGWWGRLPLLKGPDLGVTVSEEKLAAYGEHLYCLEADT